MAEIGSKDAKASQTLEENEESVFIGSNVADADQSEDLIDHDPGEGFLSESSAPLIGSWMAPALAWVLGAAWTGFYGWTFQQQILSGPSAQAAINLITGWATPLLLIVGLWLAVRYSSERQSRKFSKIARSLSDEANHLEQRLAQVNQELGNARSFISTQSSELQTLGTAAAERIGEHAEKLEALITVNGAQIDAISNGSALALKNLDQLRGELPELASSTRTMASEIESSGKSAQTQLTELNSGLERLDEYGGRSIDKIASLKQDINDALGGFEDRLTRIEDAAQERSAAIEEANAAFSKDLKDRETVALAAMQGRAEALQKELGKIEGIEAERRAAAMEALESRSVKLREQAEVIGDEVRKGEEAAINAWNGQLDAMKQRLAKIIAQIAEIDRRALEASRKKMRDLQSEGETLDAKILERSKLFMEQLESRRAEMETSDKAALDQLANQMAEFEQELGKRQQSHEKDLVKLGRRSDAITDKITAAGKTISDIVSKSREAEAAVSESVNTLGATLSDSQDELSNAQSSLTGLNEASEAMLRLLIESKSHSEETLPAAIEAVTSRLTETKRLAKTVNGEVLSATKAGAQLAHNLKQASQSPLTSLEQIDRLSEKIIEASTAQTQAMDALQSRMAELNAEREGMSEQIGHDLQAAVAQLEENGRKAVSALGDDQAEGVRALAEKVGDETAAAIEKSVKARTAASLEALELATDNASKAALAAATELQAQLSAVDQLAANLETRVASARALAEDQVDDDFARRAALLTESLNSHAIDISKALSTEVTDTAWTSYLRGDRGIFTRRAVSLLDSTEARDIAELYDNEPEFSEHVSRYIHDFEGMLRTILSARDGHAMSVTLLGSDMGKLYVALAQALERLRQ
jgi:chromosome segregation ATPase